VVIELIFIDVIISSLGLECTGSLSQSLEVFLLVVIQLISMCYNGPRVFGFNGFWPNLL